MAQIPTHDLGKHKRGDTYKLPTLAFPPSVDLTGKVARLEFRRRPSRDSELGDTIASDGDSPVLVVDELLNEVQCERFKPALGKGRWYADLQIVDPLTLDARGEPVTTTYANFEITIIDDRTV